MLFAKQLPFEWSDTYWDLKNGTNLIFKKANPTCFLQQQLGPMLWAHYLTEILLCALQWSFYLLLYLICFSQKSLIKMLVYKWHSLIPWMKCSPNSVWCKYKRKSESCNTSESTPWDCTVWWLGLYSSSENTMNFLSASLIIFLKILLLFYEVNKTDCKSYDTRW